jgi:hypothetical protein
MTGLTLITDEQVATINAARTALEAIADAAHLKNDSQASGMIFAMAAAAEGDLFQLLNWYSAYAHANLTAAQIHNK